SIAFINLKKSEKEFGYVRVWGTIGWIVAGLVLMGWRFASRSFDPIAYAGDTLLLAGIFSIIMGIHTFFLPHTPPKKEAEKPWAFLEAIKMMKDKHFAVFVTIAFVVATELMFYYNLTAPFLTSEKIGLSDAAVPGVMVIAQVAEILVMVALMPYLIARIGIRNILIIGVLAWPVRYIIFAIGKPAWLVIASLSLHGFCFVFFFVAAFIYTDMVAPRDIRHSAQSLIMVVTYGLGNLLGSLFAGGVLDYFTTEAGSNWTAVFLVPCLLTVLCALAFLLFFRPKKEPVPLEL
ncbi:MAG: MFS transporter, partial [Candidatus Aminicenantes bacterium]|nr:MFS transporter [Candidatus Aminicenantes bacterium]